MTVRRNDTGTVILDGVCAVEDAEPLLRMLQETPAAIVDWTRCRQLHTAVFQVILASGIVPIGPCGDVWVAEWLAPKLRNGIGGEATRPDAGMEPLGPQTIAPTWQEVRPTE